MLDGCTPYPAEFRERYVREGFWRAETISQAVAVAARKYRDQIAIVDERRTMTFAELADEAERFRAVLAKHGLTRGDRIIVQLPNCSEFASLMLACVDLGAIPVMVLPALRRAELEYLAALSEARAIAIAPEYRGFDHAALARELQREVASLEAIFTTAPARGCIDLHESAPTTEPFGSSHGDPFDVALFLLSGGTTGLPKLIPRTHADYLYNARETAKICDLSAKSRVLIALPAEHNFPLACPGLIGAMLASAAAVFTQSTRAEDLATTIVREGVTHVPCVPALAIALLDLPRRELRKLQSLRVITVGGQRLQEPTARALKRALPSLAVQQVFGMAEGLLCYTHLDDSADIACGTQGRPLSAADEVRIVDAAGNDAPSGELGELWCRGPYTIRGYYRAPERNAEAFTANGFYRTGDLVRRTAAGNFVVEGRIKDQINRGGEKISAEEVESHLIAHDAILAVAVVAMPDRALGERACAYVTLKAGEQLELDTIREFLAARGLARFKWPERLEIIDAMPLTNVGKIRKAELRRDIEARLAADSDRATHRGATNAQNRA
ncbi:MAG: (2,3-dihydroxybenzoyl)adenylate synthase [Candidatus Binataceae bacterium]